MDPLILEVSNNHDNQPATGAAKAGGGWQESANEVTTQPQWWAMTNDKSVQQMVLAATKRARMARAMVTAMRVLVNEEGEGSMGHGVGNEGGMPRIGRWQRWQERWQQGWRASNSNKGNGNGEGKQQSTSNGIDKGRRWLARNVNEATT
jgi:hypothetical protein